MAAAKKSLKTATKRGDKTAVESEARLRAFIDNFLCAVVTIDERDIVEAFNPTAERIFGYAASEVVGKNVKMLMPKPYHGERDGYSSDYLHPGKEKMLGGDPRREVTARRKDGTSFPVELVSTPLREGAEPIGAVLVFTDITERKRTEEARKESQARAERASGRLLDAIESIPEGFALFDSEDRLTIYNTRYRDMFFEMAGLIARGARFEDLLRAATELGVYPAANDRKEEWIAERLGWHRDASGIHEVPLKDDRWLSISERKTSDGSTIGIHTDITALKEREKQLRESEERLHSIASNVPGAIFRRVMKPDGTLHYLFVSTKCREVFGIDPEELMADGSSLRAYLHPDDYEHLEEAIRRSAETLEKQNIELRIITPGGQTKWARSLAQPRRLDDGDVVWDGIALDITERKRAEEEIRKLNAELEQRVAERTAELAAANEELRESERKLRSLVSNIPGAVYRSVLDGGWTDTFMSDGIEEITGYPAPDFIGTRVRSFMSIVHPDDLALHDECVEKARAQKKPCVIEYRIIHADGTVRWVLDRGRGVFGKGGKFLWFDGVIFDITERKRAEEALNESEARLRNLDANIPGVVFRRVLKPDGTIHYPLVSAGIWDMYGLEPEAIMADSSVALKATHPEDVERFMAALSESARKLTALEIDYRVIGRDGRTKWMLQRSRPRRLENGDVLWDCVELDITEQKRAEEEIRKLNANLAAANEELESFSYSVSHDLRAPLRSMDGFSQALLEDHADRLDAEGRDYLRRVRAGSQHMGELIDDLLTLSRVSRGELERVRVDLSKLARGIAAELHKTEPDRQVTFDIAPGVVAEGDPPLLEAVLVNLLDNAWKFTSTHPRARIAFGVAKRDGEAAYYVRDDGVGFDMAYADKLFEPFQRLHGADEFKGTGIGLATVARIVHRHRGRVWAESGVEQGTTFYFTLSPKERTA